MKIYTLLIGVLFLAGCACTPPAPQIVTQVVKVPTPVPCKIDPIDKPVMYFDQASPSNDLFRNLTLLAAENEELKAYGDKQAAAIKGCTE